MGLTLIHGNSQPNTKPRVFVVGEPSVHTAITSDPRIGCLFGMFRLRLFRKSFSFKINLDKQCNRARIRFTLTG